MSQLEVQKNKAILEKARLSRAYLDAAKSFGIEQDLEFCPCLDMSTIEAAKLKQQQQQQQRQGQTQLHSQSQSQPQPHVDSESIFKILAAAANANNGKVNNGLNTMHTTTQVKMNNVNNNTNGLKHMGSNLRNGISTIARNRYYG